MTKDMTLKGLANLRMYGEIEDMLSTLHSEDERAEWMVSPQPLLENQIPIRLMPEPGGVQQVHAAVKKMTDGAAR